MWKIRAINGIVTNIYPSRKNPFSGYRITGELLKNGKFNASGKLNRTKDPVEWSTKMEVHNVHLPEANPALVAWVPLNFAEGNLDIFSHFFIDVLTAAANLILRRSNDKSVAAIIPFHSNGKDIGVDEGKALSTALEHGFEKPLKKGLENRYGL